VLYLYEIYIMFEDNSKERLMEVMQRVNPTFKPRLNENLNIENVIPLKEYDFNSIERQVEFQNLINFIGEPNGYKNYLHTTDSIENAKAICQNGLIYDQFEKTTDYVYDSSSIIYMLGIRKAYGNYTVIIQIKPNDVKNLNTINQISTDEDGDEIYTLPPEYIKGYYDRTIKKIYPNPLFRK